MILSKAESFGWWLFFARSVPDVWLYGGEIIKKHLPRNNRVDDERPDPQMILP
jgi:hypothetical protein